MGPSLASTMGPTLALLSTLCLPTLAKLLESSNANTFVDQVS